MDEEEITVIIADYKLDFYPPNYSRRNKKHIENASLHRWAAEELEIYILSYVDVEPIDACSMFIEQMYYYREKHPNGRAMCDVAIEVAMNIQDILIAMKGMYYE